MSKRAFTVYYDDECGQLDRVVLAPGFERENDIMQLDIFQDACVRFTELYNAALQAFEQSYTEAQERLR